MYLKHKPLRKWLFRAFCVSCGMADLLGQRGVAPLSGVIIGDDGKPVQATITALKIGPPVGGGRVESANDGSFAMSGLLDGKYQLCAIDKGGNYLDPCTWSDAAPTVSISANQPVSGYKLILSKGAPLEVRLNDPSNALDAGVPGLTQARATLVVAVVTLRHTLQPLTLVSKGSGGRNHRTTIPLDRNIPLSFFGTGVTLADDSGKLLDIKLGTSIPIRIASGQSAKSLFFNVVPASTSPSPK